MASAPAAGLWLAESELSRVVWQGPDLLLRFAAARWQAPASAQAANSFGQTSWYLPGAELLLHQASTTSPLGDAVGRLRAGQLWAHGQAMPGPLAPGRWETPVELQLDFANGCCLQVQAHGLLLRLNPAAPAHEHLAC